MRFNLQAILALLVSIGGLTAHPEVMGLLPEKWALAVTIIGIIAQAFTQQVARTPSERVLDSRRF